MTESLVQFTIPEGEAIVWFVMGYVGTHGLSPVGVICESGASVFNEGISAENIAVVVDSLVAMEELQQVDAVDDAGQSIDLVGGKSGFQSNSLDGLVLAALEQAGRQTFGAIREMLSIQDPTTRILAADAVDRLHQSGNIRAYGDPTAGESLDTVTFGIDLNRN